MMRDAGKGQYTNAIVLRCVLCDPAGMYLSRSGLGYQRPGCGELWKSSVSPMSWTDPPTRQPMTSGAPTTTKAKSIKFAVGWAKYLWYEEVNEFEGAEKIRSINQSVLRGGADFPHSIPLTHHRNPELGEPALSPSREMMPRLLHLLNRSAQWWGSSSSWRQSTSRL